MIFFGAGKRCSRKEKERKIVGGMPAEGERRIDGDRACGYKIGGTITSILVHMHTDAHEIPASLLQMASLESDFKPILSVFKS